MNACSRIHVIDDLHHTQKYAPVWEKREQMYAIQVSFLDNIILLKLPYMKIKVTGILAGADITEKVVAVRLASA